MPAPVTGGPSARSIHVPIESRSMRIVTHLSGRPVHRAAIGPRSMLFTRTRAQRPVRARGNALEHDETLDCWCVLGTLLGGLLFIASGAAVILLAEYVCG